MTYGDELVVTVPGDKSLTHRALIFGALADGDSRIRHPLAGADTQSTASVLRELGCAVSSLLHDGDTIVRGVGFRGLAPPRDLLDCGNSGTTARLMMGVLAGHRFSATLTGDASLCSRPMRRVTTPLARMGARFEERGAEDRLPVTVHGGPLQSLDYESPHASAQVKSAILLAGLVGGVPVTVHEPQQSRDHTERMLAFLGVPLDISGGEGHTVRLMPPPRMDGLDFHVPGDMSSAAFVIALAVLAARGPVRVRNVGLNPGRTGFLEVIRRMGARVEVTGMRETCGEPVGDVVAERSELYATRIGAAEMPTLVDEIPIIAMLAARANGTTVIDGAQELRVKESDRIAAVVDNLRSVGVTADELDDGMIVQGTDAPLAGHVAVRHDHRIAMSFGVLAAAARDREIRIDNPGIVDVSYPGFWDMTREVAS